MNELKLKNKNLFKIKISSDNKYLVAITNKVTLYHFDGLTVLAEFKDIKNPSYVTFSSDNRLLAVKSTIGEVGIFDIRSKMFVRKFKHVHEAGDGSNIFFTLDDQFIIDGDWRGNIRLLNLQDGSIKVVEMSDNTMIKSMEFDNKENIYHIHKFNRGNYCELSTNFISRWKYDVKLKTLFKQDETNQVNKIGDAISYNRQKGYYVSTRRILLKQEEIIVFDYNLLQELKRRLIYCDVKINIIKSSISPNCAYYALAFDDKVHIYSLDDLELRKEIIAPSPNHIDFTTDSQYFYFTSRSGETFIYSTNF